MNLKYLLTFLTICSLSATSMADQQEKPTNSKTETVSEQPVGSQKQNDKPEAAPEEAQVGFDQTHGRFTEVLKNFVIVSGSKSTVNYKALKQSPAQLDSYLEQLSAVTKNEYSAFSREQKLAFLINAYNAFTLKLIINHYPVKSIKDIGGLFSSPWKKEFFKLWGKDMYLDKIEHKILRKKFKEPRIHFAVNCASIGCPALRGEAFTSEKLNMQLEEQTQIFLTDESRNFINKTSKEVHLSKIFDWFEGDFEKGGSTVAKFVAPYMTSDIDLQKQLESYEIEHTDYDWKLNEAK
ncbi:MAG: DUF547 domain-containing protein [Bdellovibrionales bacterium]|nr:DUF547 domain-containing protein [Bdellovibrionales bacterium]